MDFAIVDVETTGGKFRQESITEIAVYRFDGEKITDTFISLINPEKKIDSFVQKLTGITDKMVKTAPKFYELAKRMVEITDETIIVAHNADFDYRIIKDEFSRLGYEFQKPVIDTVSLSKHLIPGMPSYSLGKLCKSLGIPLSDRHRASGDARATVHLFEVLMAKDTEKKIIQSYVKVPQDFSLNEKINRLLENLPSESGIFYLQDKDNKVIYLEKAINIRNKATQILTSKSSKSKNIRKEVESLNFEFTGSEIISTIKEKNESSAINPKFKKFKEISALKFGIFLRENSHHCYELYSELIKPHNKKNVLISFPDWDKSSRFLTHLNSKIKSEDLSEEENSRNIYTYFTYSKLFQNEVLLIDKGRSLGEKSFLYLEKGKLKGYGYFSLHTQIKTTKMIKTLMIPAREDWEIKQLIQNHFFLDEFEKVLVLSGQEKLV